MAYLKRAYYNTTSSIDFFPLTHDIQYAIRDAGVGSGVVHIVVPKGGSGVLVFENLPEIQKFIQEWLAQWEGDTEVKDRLRRPISLAPRIQSLFLIRSMGVPFENGELLLDSYEEVVLIDCEPKSQRREVLIMIAQDFAKSVKA